MGSDLRRDEIAFIEGRIGYRFVQRNLLETAFSHASWIHERAPSLPSNQRLEFLGDALLGATVAEYLFKTYPDLDEGQMTRARAHLVDQIACATALERLGVGHLLRIGKGLHAVKPSMLADLLEAIIGAIFLDGGYAATHQFVTERCLGGVSQAVKAANLISHKSRLQILSQKHYHSIPSYALLSIEGPQNRQEFHVSVSLGARVLGTGTGRNKRQAEQRAAQMALLQFE